MMLLDSGQLPLDLVAENIDRWIEAERTGGGDKR